MVLVSERLESLEVALNATLCQVLFAAAEANGGLVLCSLRGLPSRVSWRCLEAMSVDGILVSNPSVGPVVGVTVGPAAVGRIGTGSGGTFSVVVVGDTDNSVMHGAAVLESGREAINDGRTSRVLGQVVWVPGQTVLVTRSDAGEVG